MRKILAYTILVIGLAIACEDVYEDPPQAFLEVVTENADSTDTSTPTITAYGVGMEDSLWIYQMTTDLFLLPLSLEETTSFVLLIDSIADTLTISHENKLIFESAESGFYNEFKILDVDHSLNRIDDYELTDSLVTKNWHENIKLYINSLPDSTN